MRIIAIIFIFLTIQFSGNSQDSLILKTGRRIAFSKINFLEDEIEISTYKDKDLLIFDPDSVFGTTYPYREINYFVLPNLGSLSGLKYQILERLEVGLLTLYIKRNGPGQPERTSGNFYLYLNKDNRIENIFISNVAGKRKKEFFDVFSSFINDDSISVSYINSREFKFKLKDVFEVVQYYNRRNFISKSPDSSTLFGSVYLYRTKFQKTKSGLKIRTIDQVHHLYLEDFIRLRLPINFASKLSLSDGYIKSEKILSGEFVDQYYEVLFDSKTGSYLFDKKEGSELQYEFYKIKNKTIDE